MSDSFLPSGAIASRDRGSPSKYLRASTSSPQKFNGPPISPISPISPPRTRSGSAEETAATMIEDWRAYTNSLRVQHEGERAHMMADRARMDEVMVEERMLWEKEREIMKARMAHLEAQISQLRREGNHTVASPPQMASMAPLESLAITSPDSNAVSSVSSLDSTAARIIPQESGRNADGSPFYAPAPQNPSRTFDPSSTADLRVDSLSAPRESAIRVTSKALTSSNFGLQSPPADLEGAPETTPCAHESIDISHIQPELEGVPIKASAVSPAFAAKVRSPQYTPSSAHLSPNTRPPARDAGSHLSLSPLSRNQCPTNHKMAALELVTAPENRRLTMHAGHTPNHSMTKFELLGGGESDTVTPTQARHAEQILDEAQSVVDERDAGVSNDDGDRPLLGQLGFTNDAVRDDTFLRALVEKLQEAKRSEGMSPGSMSEASSVASDGGSKYLRATVRQRSFGEYDGDDDEEKEDEGPVLRLKPSINFGRPMGRM